MRINNCWNRKIKINVEVNIFKIYLILNKNRNKDDTIDSISYKFSQLETSYIETKKLEITV